MRNLILLIAVMALIFAVGCTGTEPLNPGGSGGGNAGTGTTGQSGNPPVGNVTGNSNQTQTTSPPPQNTTTTQPSGTAPTFLPVKYFREDIQGPSGPITQITAVLDKGATEPIVIGNYGIFAKSEKEFAIVFLGRTYAISGFDISILYNSQGRPFPLVENMTLLRDDGAVVKVQNLALAENNGNYRIEELGIGYIAECLDITGTGTQRFGISKFGDLCVNGVKIYAQEVANVAGTGKYATLRFTGPEGTANTQTVYIGNSVSSDGVTLRFMEIDTGAEQGPVAIFEVQ